MRMELTVTEVVELINQVRHDRESLFEMIRTNVQDSVGSYLSTLMDIELTEFLGRKRYQRSESDPNHRNGSYPRAFTLKGIGEVGVKVQPFLVSPLILQCYSFPERGARHSI